MVILWVDVKGWQVVEPEGSGQRWYISDRTVVVNLFCNNMIFVKLLRT
jgi:hypothetical protein